MSFWSNAERQRQSDLNSEETTTSNDHSQLHGTNDQGLGNEGIYADLTDRSFNDQQYSRLHIYAKPNVKASANAEYANRGFIELTQLAEDYCNIADMAL